MKVLVTGAAGFIGMHTSLALLARGDEVVGLDNFKDYYSPQLKRDRLEHIAATAPGKPFRCVDLDVADTAGLLALFEAERFDRVVHLAAQAGVRYSLQNPHAYAQSNLVGFVNILEGCRHHGVQHLVYASSSSVYGGNVKMPFAESDPVNHPVSLYAATKKANELMAHTYSHLYGLPTTGLRFFTVYGPWGRPDMAPMLFARAMLAGEPIQIFNHGQMRRDFTYVDDIVAGVLGALDHVATSDAGFQREHPDAGSSWAPYRVYNIGNSDPVALLDFVQTLEQALGVTALKEFRPMQPGDVTATYADTSRLESLTGLRPDTPLAQGVAAFASWYRQYMGSGQA
jgi:UDP-glucuronate 4-epimerase